jgi:hypothetical protein
MNNNFRLRMKARGFREARCYRCNAVVWMTSRQRKAQCGKPNCDERAAKVRKPDPRVARAAKREQAHQESEHAAMARMGPERIDPISASRFIDSLMR